MAMNPAHRLGCRSRLWAHRVEHHLLPWALDDVALGRKTLEIGPGYGANLRVLLARTPDLTCVEIDPPMARRLQLRYGERARIITGDGTRTGLGSAEFTSVVCFTMLHHVPTPSLQDRLFAEAYRVLQPGGVFAGSDGVHSTLFRLAHLGDTYDPVPVDTLPERLRTVGFADISTDVRRGEQRWRAVKA